ncbi:MAG TPA: hypothetical protein VE871_03165 [Longimicrobium sp.]|nr:hypothetical protein [Longimicrobium sp.]
MQQTSESRSALSAAPRRTWTAPRVDDMPRLTDLTLQTNGGIPGDCDDSNPSSCFG